jgi:hypothetical protein
MILVSSNLIFYSLFSLQILKFRTVAKLTQRIYGIRSTAAGFEIRRKLRKVRIIDVNKRRMSIKAISGKCNPKKIIDQRKLNINCTEKKLILFM